MNLKPRFKKLKDITKTAQGSLALMVALTIVMVEVSALISTISVSHFQNKADSVDATQALILVDSAMEEALYRLREDASYSGGSLTLPDGSNASITVTDLGGDDRRVDVTTTNTAVLRQLSATMEVEEITVNPLVEYAVFGGDRVRVQNNAVFYGNVRANDNIWLYNDAIVYGNIFLSGDGSSSNTRIRNDAQVLGNPLTAVLEGYAYSVDDIYIQNNGYLQRDAYSEKRVRTFQSGSYGGTAYQYQDLDLDPIPIPQFDFDTWESIAQTNGTYYSNPSQFLNYLSLNGNTVSGGVHFIDSSSNITIPAGNDYDITGSIISRGAIEIRADNYTQVRDPAYDDIPVLATSSRIVITDSSYCNCKVDIEGALYALGDIDVARGVYSGSFPAVDIEGTLWSGDDITVGHNTRFTYNEDVSTTLGPGFEFEGGGTGTGNLIVTSWTIN